MYLQKLFLVGSLQKVVEVVVGVVVVWFGSLSNGRVGERRYQAFEQ